MVEFLYDNGKHAASTTRGTAKYIKGASAKCSKFYFVSLIRGGFYAGCGIGNGWCGSAHNKEQYKEGLCLLMTQVGEVRWRVKVGYTSAAEG